MGREALCRAKFGGKASEGKALLETDDVIFRGDFRVKAPLRDITSVRAKDGALTLVWPEGTLTLALGKAAEAWAKAITNPKTVMEKLGVKPGLEVAVVGRFETSFRAEVMDALGVKPRVKPAPGCDLVLVLVAHPGDEEKIADLVPAIAPAGAIWAIYPKGRRDVSEDTVRAAAHAAGLVDTKVARVSDKLGALKVVIPKAARADR